MSVDSRIPAARTQGNREVFDVKNAQVPQSAILYLLQEATKLALPEARQDCPDSMVMDGIWSGEWSEQHMRYNSPLGSTSTSPFSNHSAHFTDPQHSFEGHSSLLPTELGSSPWEVMSLINLQCERLLHPENGEEGEAERLAAAPVFEDKPSATGDSKSRHSRGPSNCNEGDASPANPQNITEGLGQAVGSCSSENKAGFTKKCGANLGETESVQCNKYMARGSQVQAQVTVITDRFGCAINARGGGDQAIGSIQVAGTHHSRNSFLSKDNEDWPLDGRRETALGSNSDGKGHDLCGSHCAPQSEPDTNILGSVVRQKSVLPESSFSANTDELVRSSSAFCTSALGASLVSDPGVKMDCNSNAIPFVDPPQDVQSQSGPQATSDNSNCESVAQNTVSQEGSLALLSKSHDSYVGNVDEEQLKLKTNRPASDVRWQARRPRKQSHPTRSADLCDPNFKGVTFRMRTELNDNRDQCRLLITSNYSAELLKSIRRARGSRPRPFANSLKTSSSEEDSDSSSLCKNKMCASCNTKKTPLWRDAEDGTPLCNACGIRHLADALIQSDVQQIIIKIGMCT
ncbi:GATA-type zinc finger protein 1 isoform X2 [Conger conger]|uniref:GATA-type zinc finger protein 1 isoform X2 n=1 Tax=Conger conger TaxID=82655 RepID=UPI002A5A2B69|nr:GATA-type zinc finger protein 1 isoform X2 [Conger conger]